MLRLAGLSNADVAALLGVPLASARRLASKGRDLPAESPPPRGAKPRRHVFIPDTQVKPDDPTGHLVWAGRYIAEHGCDAIIHAGDHWDMPSLSSYEQRGSKYFEGKRYRADVGAGNAGLELFENGLAGNGGYAGRKVLLRGNHEDRITRAVASDPRLEGILGFHDFNDLALGWEVHDFLRPVLIDGLTYAHYFYQPNSGRPYSGAIDTMLRNIGFSFVQGHQQGLRWGRRELNNGTVQIGLVAGSFYQHAEIYRGHQATAEWRGIVVLNEVYEGRYDPSFISLDYLRRRFA